MNIRPFAYALATTALACSLAACAGGINSFPQPTIPPNCVLPAGVTAQLLYPIPGATGVPDAPQQIVFAISSPLPTWGAAVETGGVGAYGNVFQTITAGQVPSPSATPSFANPIYVSSTLNTAFGAHSVVGVDLNDLSSQCAPAPTGSSFTTL